MRVQSVGPERAGDGTESVMMTPGYLWARLMHADVGGGGGGGGVVRQAARVKPRCDKLGFSDSRMRKGCVIVFSFFLSSVCSRTGQEVSGYVGDRETRSLSAFFFCRG